MTSLISFYMQQISDVDDKPPRARSKTTYFYLFHLFQGDLSWWQLFLSQFFGRFPLSSLSINQNLWALVSSRHQSASTSITQWHCGNVIANKKGKNVLSPLPPSFVTPCNFVYHWTVYWHQTSKQSPPQSPKASQAVEEEPPGPLVPPLGQPWHTLAPPLGRPWDTCLTPRLPFAGQLGPVS